MLKLVRSEAESGPLADYLDTRQGEVFVTSELAALEVTRAARRLIEPPESGEAIAEAVLAGVDLISVTETILTAARHTLPLTLRTLDAVHLQTALEVGTVEAFVCYDSRLTAAARAAGITTTSPS